jgi:hypothetical protein
MKCTNCKDETSNAKFCSRSCAASFNNKGVRRHGEALPKCKGCDETVKRKGAIYCSKPCSHRYKFEQSIKDWYAGGDLGMWTIRKHLFEKHDQKCTKCGWGEINQYSKVNLPPLEVDHIDGCYENNRPENLDLLCLNCHSLTPTFKALNKGNGRPYNKHR